MRLAIWIARTLRSSLKLAIASSPSYPIRQRPVLPLRVNDAVVSLRNDSSLDLKNARDQIEILVRRASMHEVMKGFAARAALRLTKRFLG